MKFHYFLPAMLAIVACQKEDTSLPAPQGNGTRLIKEVVMNGRTKTTRQYSYNAEDKLVTLQQDVTGNGIAEHKGLRIVRTQAGVIEKIIFLAAGSADSLTIDVTYSNDRYQVAVWRLKRINGMQINHTDFVSDNAGHIVQASTSTNYMGFITRAVIVDFAYLQNNLQAVKIFQTIGDTNRLLWQDDFEYDLKNNPLPLGNEWILVSLSIGEFYSLCSTNNVAKGRRQQYGSPDEGFTVSYAYNERNRPVSATRQFTDPRQAPTTTTFTYQ